MAGMTNGQFTKVLRQLRLHATEQLTAEDRDTLCRSEQEPGGCDALDIAPVIPQLCPQCRATITVYKRGHNWDAGNAEVKAIVDALIEAHVCEDDSITFLPEVLRRGVQVRTLEEERTVVELFLIDSDQPLYH